MAGCPANVGDIPFIGGVIPFGADNPNVPIETEFLAANLSRRWYAVLQVRPAGGFASPDFEYATTPLIPPGGVFRQRFLELLPGTSGCPDGLTMRVFLYKRVNEQLPIGLDPGEAVQATPVASVEISDIAACAEVVASSFSAIIRDTEEGSGVIAFAQSTSAENVVSFSGVGPAGLAPVPALLAPSPLSGRVTSPTGAPEAGVGVLLRTRFRVGDDDAAICPNEPVGVCFSDPIDFAVTDGDGRFSFERPPGAYMVEAFADTLQFRPAAILVETPIDNLAFIAEAAP